MKTSLAMALLRRKELNGKVTQLALINQRDLYEVKAKRISVTDSVDQVTAQVPKISFNQVTAAYDYYAKSLREIDLVIQQANHATVVDVPDHSMKDFIDPYVEDK